MNEYNLTQYNILILLITPDSDIGLYGHGQKDLDPGLEKGYKTRTKYDVYNCLFLHIFENWK